MKSEVVHKRRRLENERQFVYDRFVLLEINEEETRLIRTILSLAKLNPNINDIPNSSKVIELIKKIQTIEDIEKGHDTLLFV